MRIGIVTDNLPWEGLGGGIGTYTVLTAHELVRRGIEVHVFRWRSEEGYSRYERDGVHYHLCPKWISLRGDSPKYGLMLQFSSRMNPPLAETQILRSVIEKVSSEKPFDVIEFPEFEGYGKAGIGLKGVKHVSVRLHGCSKLVRHFAGESEDAPMQKVDALEREVALKADSVTSVSRSALQATQKIWKTSLENATVVPNPIERMIESFDEVSERLPTTVFFGGRLEARKGIETLSAAIPLIVEAVPDVQFQIFGKDKEWDDGRTGAEIVHAMLDANPHLRGKVLVPGAVSREELLTHLRRATLAVVPSLYENQPFAVLEALALATPLLVSDISAHTEMITNSEMGETFKVGNAKDFACRVISLLENSERRNSLSRGALARSRAYETEPIVDSLLSCWGVH